MVDFGAERFEAELRVASDAVRRAALACRAVQARIIESDATRDELTKDDRSPVTVADFASQAIVCRGLGESFPDDPVIGEEDSAALRTADHALILERVTHEVRSVLGQAEADDVCQWIDRGGAKDHSPRFWTLDPIDGTKGFLRGEQYAIALALIVDGELALGALGCPRLEHGEKTGLLFTATNAGATVSALFGDDAAQGDAAAEEVHVSEVDDLREARTCESVEKAHSSHSDSARLAEHLGIEAEPYRIDSQAKYGAVAMGRADVYLRLPTRPGYVEKIWDHAAGAHLVTAAGGRVTDVEGRPLDFGHGYQLAANRGVVATNGRLHDRVLAGLRAIGVARG